MSEYYAVQRSGEYLEHYGIKGMKWGVRKAIADGNGRALRRQYNKAVKKLAKLEKRGASGAKSAKKAAAYGAGAALAGGIAGIGTSRIGSAMETVGGAFRNSKNKRIRNIASAVEVAGTGLNKWGNSASGVAKRASNFLTSEKVANLGRNYHGVGGQVVREAGRLAGQAGGAVGSAVKGASRHTMARIGAGAVSLGLGAAAARNAYKAATAKRNRQKAAQFKAEMQKAFAGTQYANGAPRQGKKRRRS